MKLFLHIFILLGFLSFSADSQAQIPTPIAENGVLDLRNWDFSNNKETVELSGEWNFAFREFVSPESLSQSQNFETVTVPHNWANQKFGEQVSDGRGYGTYYLRVLLPEQHPPLALRLNGLSYAATIFANGNVIKTIGTPGKTASEERPISMVTIAGVPDHKTAQNVLDLVIHQSNFIHARGGMIASIKLGTAKSILVDYARYHSLLLAMIGGMSALMLYYLVMFATRPKIRTSLYFSLFLLAAVVHMSSGTGALVDAFPTISGYMFLRLEYLMIVGGALAWYLLIYSLYPQVAFKWVHRGVLAYSALALTSLFVLGSYQFTSLLPLYNIGMLLTTIAMMISVGIAVHRSLPDSATLLAGILIAFIALIFGVFLNREAGTPMSLMIYLSFTALVLSQAITLGRQIARNTRKTEQLGLELKEANAELEGRVKDRTAQLNKAMHEAKAASQIKSDFLATMSHEIRTPMNGVIGMTNVVLDGDLCKEQRQNMRAIEQSAKSLMTILDDILDMSKIEAGKMTVKVSNFSPKSVIDNTLALWKVPIEEKGLQLKVQLADNLPEQVLGDETRLSQILSNLLSNARKFTPEGHVKLSVKIKEVDGTFMFLFRITDTGPGIDRYKVGAIFKTFTQEDQSSSRNHGGVGIGVPISAELARLMGGTLKYDSSYEKGAAFILRVPFKEAVALTETKQKITAAPKKTKRRLKVLIAEDNAINRKVIGAMLGKMPFDLSFAHDGVEAVDMSASELFDIILMDIQMPNMSGIEATAAIRTTNNLNKKTPIIATTANTMKGDRETYLNAGMNDFIPKPLNPKLLITAMVTAVKTAPKKHNKPSNQSKVA